MTSKIVWMDGHLVPWADAQVHVSCHGLNYGLGFFEGIRCQATPAGPAIFRLADHVSRLIRSASIYRITLPYSAAQLAGACKSVVRENSLDECYLRPITFLGENPDPFAAIWHVAIMALDTGPLVGEPSPDPRTAKVVSVARISANALPSAAKATGQYLNSFLAQVEARDSGCQDAILLNEHGTVSDAWAHNLFTVKEGVVMTPPGSAGILPGVTRASLLQLAAEAGLPVREQELTRTDLYVADECFLSGTAAGVTPLAAVDGRPVGDGQPGPVTRKLARMLSDVARGRVPDHPEWRELVL
jgi:branched-chain amino acid aminotransferase